MKKIKFILICLFGMISIGASAQEWNQYDANRDGVVDVADITAVANYILNGHQPVDPYNGHEYVDLGLPNGLKWATCNVGAISPEDYGDYYAWGETETKDYYFWSSYFDTIDDGTTFTKYNNNGGKTVLDLEDDVAHVKWGGTWRMPTDAEFTELRTNCTWEWTYEKGVYGRKVTGPNGNSIFLSAAGFRRGSGLNDAGSYGYYWSSSLIEVGQDCACYVYFNSGNMGRYYSNRFYGQSVRPVCP